MSKKTCGMCKHWERGNETILSRGVTMLWGFCFAPVPEWVDPVNARCDGQDADDCDVFDAIGGNDETQ